MSEATNLLKFQRVYARMDNINKPVGEVFGTKLHFNNQRCDHSNGIGTDLEINYIDLFGQEFFKRNNEQFKNGVQQQHISDVARELTSNILKENFGISFQTYQETIMNVEDEFQHCQHYDLFMVAAFQSIYAHTTAYFGLDDLFTAHREFVFTFVRKYGVRICNNVPFSQNRYDDIIFGTINGQNNEPYREQTHFKFINELCELFERNFYKSIVPDIKILASLILFNYYGFVTFNNHYYIVENLKKAGCCHTIHNASFQYINELLGYNYYTWFETYINRYPDSGMATTMAQIDEDPLSETYEDIFYLVKRKFGVLEKHKEPHKLNAIIKTKMANYNYDKLTLRSFIRIPINVKIKQLNDINVLLEYGGGTLSFFPGVKFVLMSCTKPNTDAMMEKEKSKYNGPYAILANGRRTLIYNHIQKRYYRYTHQCRITLEGDDHQIWVQTIVPSWNVACHRMKNRILVANQKRYPEYRNMAKDLEMGLRQIGYCPIDITNCIKLFEWYSDPVAQQIVGYKQH